jgi:hypothetical protein
LQIDDLNALLIKRQREAKRLRAQVASLAGMPKEGLSLKQLAARAALADTLQRQNDALAAENDALQRAAAARGDVGKAVKGESTVGERAARQLRALADVFTVWPASSMYIARSRTL